MTAGRRLGRVGASAGRRVRRRIAGVAGRAGEGAGRRGGRRCGAGRRVAAHVGRATYIGSVRMQRQTVDYALQRRALLAAVHAGRKAVSSVCDADPYLLRAAKFHGRPSEVLCPICRKEQVTLVNWVFGDSLGSATGSARSEAEVTEFANSRKEFTVHEVEVCRSCNWNHLVQSYVAGQPPRPRKSRAARG